MEVLPSALLELALLVLTLDLLRPPHRQGLGPAGVEVGGQSLQAGLLGGRRRFGRRRLLCLRHLRLQGEPASRAAARGGILSPIKLVAVQIYSASDIQLLGLARLEPAQG